MLPYGSSAVDDPMATVSGGDSGVTRAAVGGTALTVAAGAVLAPTAAPLAAGAPAAGADAAGALAAGAGAAGFAAGGGAAVEHAVIAARHTALQVTIASCLFINAYRGLVSRRPGCASHPGEQHPSP